MPHVQLGLDDDDDQSSMKEVKSTLDKSDRGNDGFTVVDERDMIKAIADFSALCVTKTPGAKSVSPEQLQKMLSSSFYSLQPPSTLGKIWKWGSFVYTTYGYGQYAYYLYRQPAVANGIITVAKWMLVLILP